ncbi:MAG TPA: hypothetical protein EYQ31_02645 [Candidatus Handelsmanbacteria bacterium]|nr:hypothetical protein [Candidatus Handelsmanbacteria bacterium]
MEPMILHIPCYTEHVTAAMHRAQTHDERVLVIRVELVDGTVGFGDRLGFALQVALLDAVGRATDTPAHALPAVVVGSGHAC